MKLPKTAYILLWFPKPSETFVFREVIGLRKMGLPLKVYTLYGKINKGLSPEMKSASSGVKRLGIPYLTYAYRDISHWWKKDPKTVIGILKTMCLKPWYGLEKTAENFWALLCAFHLARRFDKEEIDHIHAPWACGPATAAWIASRLTDIPFSFTARAGDIFPPDGMLKDKIRDSVFVRTNNRANINHLRRFAAGNMDKIHMIYNGVAHHRYQDSPVTMKPPYRLLALGRFVGKKGYKCLIKSCKILRDWGMDFRLTLAGDGPQRRELKNLTRKLGLVDRISFPGFVSHDQVSKLFCSADVFLMPSIVHSSGDRDGIPNVIIEALMHRVPVIATAISGIPEVIEDGVTGLLIPENDPSAVSRAVLGLVRDRRSAIEMAERGRLKVQKQFNAQKNCQKILLLYQQSLF